MGLKEDDFKDSNYGLQWFLLPLVICIVLRMYEDEEEKNLNPKSDGKLNHVVKIFSTKYLIESVHKQVSNRTQGGKIENGST